MAYKHIPVSKPYASGYGATRESKTTTTHGRILREERVARGLSQAAMGGLIDRDHAEISRMERTTDYLPRVALLVAHLNALGMGLAIVRPNGDVVILPASDFLNSDGSPKGPRRK
ncbi:hypothetical protein CMI37_07625 [Candidatus Pacearchaeota archaeon]|jgi:transcriptional regulator with XRE-family HTH domain|nr:hypothetical protein [Candidatus Pacearchaeota archaeon]